MFMSLKLLGIGYLDSPKHFAATAPSGFSGVSDVDETNILVNMPVFGMEGGDYIKNVDSIKKMVSLLQGIVNTNV